jgi:hypothetical protein
MLLFRRAALFGALASLPAACSAPDALGLFDTAPDPGPGSSVVVPQCVDRCRGAALKCTLINVPCDALCGAGLNGEQLRCLEGASCDADAGDTPLVDCVGTPDVANGFFGARCECGGVPTCDADCLSGLLCFDPGGSDTGDDFNTLFPGFCSKRCNPADAGSCPSGFTCREQLFNNEPVSDRENDRYWCER